MKFSIDIEEEIDNFFEPPPDEGPGDGPLYSILFLLRRDLRDVSGPETEQNHNLLKVPVLASFGIMAGFELLARIWTGNNDLKQTDLKKAFQELLEIDSPAANMMVHFRNAIGHGYQLSIYARDGKDYHFAIDDSKHVKTSFFEQDETRKNCVIQFWELRSRFITAIHRMHNLLKDPENQTIRENFYHMIPYIRPYEIKLSYGFKRPA